MFSPLYPLHKYRAPRLRDPDRVIRDLCRPRKHPLRCTYPIVTRVFQVREAIESLDPDQADFQREQSNETHAGPLTLSHTPQPLVRFDYHSLSTDTQDAPCLTERNRE